MKRSEQNQMRACAFESNLGKETDRGCALVCVSFLETELGALLRGVFVDCEEVTDKLFGPHGPLSTFSSRVEVAFSLGLLTNDSYRTIGLIRRIRNDFAHDYKERSFADHDVAQRCTEIARLCVSPVAASPRETFISAAISLIALIHIKAAFSAHSSIPPGQIDFGSGESLLEAGIATLTECYYSLPPDRLIRLLDPQPEGSEMMQFAEEVVARLKAKGEPSQGGRHIHPRVGSNYFKLTHYRICKEGKEQSNRYQRNLPTSQPTSVSTPLMTRHVTIGK